jgi:hypothetical protein
VPESKDTVVKIYVRLTERADKLDADERLISFRIPEGVDPMELLDEGFAIDGNQAVFTVAEVFDEGTEHPCFDAPFGERGETLSRALATAQRELVSYLREHGFQPQFA